MSDYSPDEAADRCAAVLDAVAESVVADRGFLETVLTAVVARGHVLLEDAPGTGKTLTAKSLAAALGLSFSRVQFTPDLLPADVTGTHVYDEGFAFREGPIFANVVLADEINRAPPKTQAALLEAMSEAQVTVDGETRPLPDPFVVVATQNPVESEGTFPLPEAQVDRFAVKASIGYPDADAELDLLRRRTRRRTKMPDARTVLDPDSVRALQDAAERVRVADDVLGYIRNVAAATREDSRLRLGVSPRGTQVLMECARAHATLAGREYVTPDDVKVLAEPVLAHRVVLSPDAAVEAVDAASVVADVLDAVAVPTVTGVDSDDPDAP